jgi:hypothetical protein
MSFQFDAASIPPGLNGCEPSFGQSSPDFDSLPYFLLKPPKHPQIQIMICLFESSQQSNQSVFSYKNHHLFCPYVRESLIIS